MRSCGLSALNLTWKWHGRNDFGGKNRYKPSAYNKTHVDFFPRRLFVVAVCQMKIETREKTSLSLEAEESERFLIRADRKRNGKKSVKREREKRDLLQSKVHSQRL